MCGECGSPYRRVTYMPSGRKRFVWRCINRLEHGKRICQHAPTMEEPEIQAAITAAMNELFRQQTARQTLAACIATALAGTDNGDLTLPAVESRLCALQERQMELFGLAAADPDNIEYDEELRRVTEAKLTLQARKDELIQQGHTDTEYNSRVQSITAALETTDSAIENFDEGMVKQTVASVTVLDAERLSIRFKDGTEVEQEVIEIMRRASA